MADARRKSVTGMADQPDLEVPGQYVTRLKALKPLVEAVIEDEIDLDTLLGVVVERGLRALVEDLIGQMDQPTLIESVVQMSAENPEFAFTFIAERLKEGALSQAREEARRKLGFMPAPQST